MDIINETKEILVGIDFGTTNTVITHFVNNKAVTLVDGVFKTIPSKIAKANGKLYCGNYIPINTPGIIHSFKITIGESNEFFFDPTDPVKYSHGELLVVFFTHLYELICKNLKLSGQPGQFVIKAVITVPSNFNDNQREIIKAGFNSVGFQVIRIINEPSAAALAYGLSHSSNSDEMILVIDTGGGTMDFTILQKSDLFFEVVHSEGLNDLGGNNFTSLIREDILRTGHFTGQETNLNETVLWNQAQKIKEKLTYLDIWETNIKNIIDLHSFPYVITRSRFENMANILIQKVENTLVNILEQYSGINWIILVGGTSRIPVLQETIKRVSGKNPWIHPNLESVVAEGAGLYAGIIENKFQANDDVVLMDVLPLSLGVELADGSYSVIVPKNTPLPVKRGQKYTTDTPGESAIKVKVYQGERPIANKNFLIGEFIFDKVTAGGVPIIDIAFKIDLSSIINVIISDRKSGVESSIIIKDIPQISSEDLENIISQATSLADADEAELLRAQNIYIIRAHIENALVNLSINDKMEESDKESMLEKFKLIEDQLEQMENIKLVETIKYLQDNFSMIGSVSSNNLDEPDESMDQVEKMFFTECKQELATRIKILLAANPEWEEFLAPVLEELSYNTVTMDYVNDKLKLLEELEENDDDTGKAINDTRDYKQEVNNLCLYLKTEIESGSIDLGAEKNALLINLVNENLENLDLDSNVFVIDWKHYLEVLNTRCEELYTT